MLEKEKAIDAVLIATPDHLHAYVSILAMKAGKHVYCEKPLTHNIREARLVARVAKETGVATQMGNQGRSGEGHRQTVEWLNDGAIGAVREVHAWSGDAGVLQRDLCQPERPSRAAGRSQLGPLARAPRRTALPAGATRRGWRYFWDFGNGTMPDMGIHHFDPAFNALGLDAPHHHGGEGVRGGSGNDHGSDLVTYRYRRPGKPGTAHRVLVRQRPPAADSARHRSRRPEAAARGRRKRPADRWREGDPHLRRLVRHAASASAPPWPSTGRYRNFEELPKDLI